ncbi:MAG TPA: hypothetical protein VE975_01330 [Actinomycetota bacterium]|nr:hypothetical protein [Actinomycetota bacterium]
MTGPAWIAPKQRVRRAGRASNPVSGAVLVLAIIALHGVSSAHGMNAASSPVHAAGSQAHAIATTPAALGASRSDGLAAGGSWSPVDLEGRCLGTTPSDKGASGGRSCETPLYDCGRSRALTPPTDFRGAPPHGIYRLGVLLR